MSNRYQDEKRSYPTEIFIGRFKSEYIMYSLVYSQFPSLFGSLCDRVFVFSALCFPEILWLSCVWTCCFNRSQSPGVIKDQFWGCHIWGYGKIYMSLKPICLSVSRSYSLSCTELLDMLNSNSEWHKENEWVFSCQCVADTALIQCRNSSLMSSQKRICLFPLFHV